MSLQLRNMYKKNRNSAIESRASAAERAKANKRDGNIKMALMWMNLWHKMNARIAEYNKLLS